MSKNKFPFSPSGPRYLHEPGSRYLRHTLSTRVRLAQPGLEIFSRPSKAMASNLLWRDLIRPYDFLIVRIFSFTRLYPYLLKIYLSESQANLCLHEEIDKNLTPSVLHTRVLNRVTQQTELVHVNANSSLFVDGLTRVGELTYIGSTLTFLYFDLYLNTAYAAHYVYFNTCYKFEIKWDEIRLV